MNKKINTWFECYFCPIETDEGREVEYKGSRVKMCMECYKSKKHLKEESNGKGSSKIL